ncbi:hypothetical protein JCM10450v2_007405 [Rhodotorula kratochvilovae]
MARTPRPRTAPDRTSTLSSAPPPWTSASHPTPAPPPPPDLFVLVRPPPSSASHPLNVQIQLLEPSSVRAPPAERPLSRLSAATGPPTPGSTDGRSFDAVAGASVAQSGEGAEQDAADEDDELRGEEGARSRSPSVSSTRSGRSGTSGESTWTSGTSASGGSRRRTVKPLLNLECHNLLPTVVTDAGTEQRVARFHKRGIELTGLAVFDPTYLNPPTAASPSSLAVPTTPTSSLKPDSGFLGKFKRLSFNPSVPPSSLSSSTSSQAPDSGPAPHTLSLVRTHSPPAPSPAPTAGGDQKPGYAFLLRKWLRADLLDAPRGVRVEWTRAPLQRRKRAGAGAGSQSAPGSRRGSAQDEEEEDDDDDAKAVEEEEERAWLCTLVYPLSGAAASPSLSGGGAPSPSPPPSTSPAPSPPLGGAPPAPAAAQRTRRLALATLRPAPHHPKLVSTLLLPPALPSIPLGSFHPSRGLVGGALAPADLRDLAMVSALFVAVREGLGGLEGAVGGAGEAGLGLGTSRSAGGVGGEGDGMAALTEKAGLAIQGLVPVASGGGKRKTAPAGAPARGGGFAAGLGRFFGAK